MIGSMCDSITFRGFIPPVAYLPSLAASKLPAADHPKTDAVAWVARWERLHFRIRSEVKSREEDIRRAVCRIYAGGGLHPPAQIEIARDPNRLTAKWENFLSGMSWPRFS